LPLPPLLPLLPPPPPPPPPFPYTTLFRSSARSRRDDRRHARAPGTRRAPRPRRPPPGRGRTRAPGAPCASTGGAGTRPPGARARSEEHTSELQSRENLVCRLLLEKKKKKE